MEDQSCRSGNHGNGSENQWRAEEAIAGNSDALKALRELIIFPLLFSQEAQKIGLRVRQFLSMSFIISSLSRFLVSLIVNITMMLNSGLEDCFYTDPLALAR